MTNTLSQITKLLEAEPNGLLAYSRSFEKLSSDPTRYISGRPKLTFYRNTGRESIPLIIALRNPETIIEIINDWLSKLVDKTGSAYQEYEITSSQAGYEVFSVMPK